MFPKIVRAGEKEAERHEAPEDLDDKTRRQYLAIMQYLMDREFIETLSAFESETGLKYNEGSVPVASVLETSLDMFASYSKGKDASKPTADEELLQVEEGICCTAQSPMTPKEAIKTNVIAVAWAALREDDLTALVATADRRLRLLGSDGSALAEFTSLSSPVLGLDVSPSSASAAARTAGQEVLATAMGGEVVLLHLRRPLSAAGDEDDAAFALELKQQFKDHTKHATAGRFAPPREDGSLSLNFVTISRDRKANLYSRESEADDGGAAKFVLSGSVSFVGEVTCCCWASARTFVLAARDDHHLHYWDVGEGPADQPSLRLKTSLNANNDGVVSFAVLAIATSPDHQLIAACTDKSRVIVLKAFTNVQLRNLYGAVVDEYDVPSISFSLDRCFLYATSSIAAQALAKRQQDESERAGNSVTRAAECGKVAIFEVKSGQLVLQLHCHEKPVRCMQRHPHTEAIITGSFDKAVKYWS
mmetsp:Transcript_40489/g.75885  ORF Transcript_40489/g.75885 Transcript_40489/m.75885 type:complete len:476 (-) Transcript_40489:57-1484(-)